MIRQHNRANAPPRTPYCHPQDENNQKRAMFHSRGRDIHAAIFMGPIPALKATEEPIHRDLVCPT